MKNFVIIALVLFTSCSGSKKLGNTADAGGRLNIQLTAGKEKYNLKGLYVISRDSSYFNVFGPLGINLARIKAFGDSIYIADMQNKILYKAYYRNLSLSIYNVFTGNYTKRDEPLFCSFFYLINKSLIQRLDCLENSGGRSGIKYNFSNGKKKSIELSAGHEEETYQLIMNLIPGAENRVFSSQVFKNTNFQIVSIKL